LLPVVIGPRRLNFAAALLTSAILLKVIYRSFAY
jgi:hypothetical protein